MTGPRVRSFTSSYSGLSRVLKNKCLVSEAFDPRSGGTPPTSTEFDALWDTGATNSVITQQVIDKCNLSPTGMVTVHAANGSYTAETYLVNIALPNGVTFSGLRVTKGDVSGTDMLIGMDVISQGDLAVTNHGGVTKFSFRMPSQSHIDFVADGDRARPSARPQFQHGGRGKKRKKPPSKRKKR